MRGGAVSGRTVSGRTVSGRAVSGRAVSGRGLVRGIIGSGVLWFGLYMITLNWGEREVDAGTAAMVVTIGPILIAPLAGWLLRERFPRRLGAGMAVSLAGAIVVGISESGGGRTSVIGVVLCVVAAVCYAAGVVFQKPALGHASAIQVTAFGCFTGTVACLPFAGQLVSQLGSAPVSDTLNVVYLGLFPTMLGFTTWAYALARTPSGKMGATTYTVPGLVVLMSWLILGQVPRWLTIAGGALCLAGVAVSRSRSARKATPAPPVTVAAEARPPVTTADLPQPSPYFGWTSRGSR
jgi:drug/metabolite transporter (DMT)-like permease